MKVPPLAIPDVVQIKPKVFGNAKISFKSRLTLSNLRQLLVKNEICTERPESLQQEGATLPTTYHPLTPKSKLVRVTSGGVLDLAVDICKSSPPFGNWVGEELSETKNRQQWIPPSFVHGLVVLSDKADFLYKTTNYCAASHARCNTWNDLGVGIDWPVLNTALQLCQKDAVGLSHSHTAVFP